MAKEYWLKFDSSLPSTLGLSPTFIVFKSWTGGVVTPPGITQQLASYGLYRFEYTPSFPIIFVADGATSSLGSNRYLTGSLDPLDLVNERLDEVGSTLSYIGQTLIPSMGGTLTYIGNNIGLTLLPSMGQTLVALGNSNIVDLTPVLNLIGTTASTFGDSSTDPGTIYGYLKRVQENLEGNADFNKTSGVWQIESRGGTLLASKTLTNSTSTVTKS